MMVFGLQGTKMWSLNRMCALNRRCGYVISCGHYDLELAKQLGQLKHLKLDSYTFFRVRTDSSPIGRNISFGILLCETCYWECHVYMYNEFCRAFASSALSFLSFHCIAVFFAHFRCRLKIWWSILPAVYHCNNYNSSSYCMSNTWHQPISVVLLLFCYNCSSIY